VRQAELTGAPLEIVSTWEWPVSYSGWETLDPPDYDPADEARQQLDKAVSAVLTPRDAVEVRRSVIQGHAAPVLEALSKTADLVVVGSQGHGEFVGMLLGSVSEHCVTHCHCPVVVIRGAIPAGHVEQGETSRMPEELEDSLQDRAPSWRPRGGT
jgi:nucleotide-binding universal stress UspA family protein